MFWRACYCLATWAALPFVFAYFAWRSRREPGYRHHWRERLGAGEAVPGSPIWIHAASVGEVVLIAPLVNALRERYRGVALLITTMTPTGRAQAQHRFGDDVYYRYIPLDTLDATRRFFRRVNPRIGVITETELWPNLVAAADQSQVPLALVNASLSARSERRYRHAALAASMRFMLARFAVIAASTERHARRFASLGADPEAVHVTGNLKYDMPETQAITKDGATLRSDWQATARPVWVAASTHAGEERRLVEAYDSVLKTHGNTLLVIAPRHPQRFDAVARELSGSGYRVARRSLGEPVTPATDIVLADTLGEVPVFYAAADVVFVGGSLLPGVGGHNMIEAAALGRPLCVGPYIEEWQDVVDTLVAVDGAAICANPRELARRVAAWLDQPAMLEQAGQSAAEVAATHRGAVARSLALIEDLMGVES